MQCPPRLFSLATAVLASAGAALFLPATVSAAVPFLYTQLTPDIFTFNQTSPTTVEVTVTAEVASVSFVRLQEPPRPLRNDGQGGDRVAGDRVFTLRLEAAELLTWLEGFPTRSRSRTLSAGTVSARSSNGTVLGGVNVNLPVKTDAIPAAPLISLSAAVQYTPHVVNVVMPMSYLTGAGGSDSAVTQTFYSHFQDAFQFVTIVFAGSAFRTTHFTLAQESIAGLGRVPSPLNPDWGSASKLEGVVHIFGGAAFGLTGGCGTTLFHEIGHRWINSLHGGLDDPNGLHWPLGTLAGGIMGFSAVDPNSNGNGGGILPGGSFVPDGNDLRLVKDRKCPVFNPVELYLMGLRSSAGVPAQLVAADQLQPRPVSDDARIAGPFNTVTLGQAIAANGARVPSFVNAPKEFRTATIVVTPERPASANFMHWMESEAVYLDSFFFDATAGAGRLRSEVDSARLTPPIVGPRIIRVRHEGSMMSSPLSPGALIRIEGSGLGPAGTVEAVPVSGAGGPTTLGSTRVSIGGQSAALLSVSASAIVAVVPSSVPIRRPVEIQVERILPTFTLSSNTVAIPLARTSTALFSANGLGSGLAVGFDQNGVPNSFANPAPGSATLDLIVNGAGPFATALPDGSLVPASATPSPLTTPVEVFVNGQPANVISATNIPGELSSKARIRFQLPFAIDSSLQRRVQVHIGGVTSQAGIVVAVVPSPAP